MVGNPHARAFVRHHGLQVVLRPAKHCRAGIMDPRMALLPVARFDVVRESEQGKVDDFGHFADVDPSLGVALVIAPRTVVLVVTCEHFGGGERLDAVLERLPVLLCQLLWSCARPETFN